MDDQLLPVLFLYPINNGFGDLQVKQLLNCRLNELQWQKFSL